MGPAFQQPVTLEFRDAPLRTVFEALSRWHDAQTSVWVAFLSCPFSDTPLCTEWQVVQVILPAGLLPGFGVDSLRTQFLKVASQSSFTPRCPGCDAQ